MLAGIGGTGGTEENRGDAGGVGRPRLGAEYERGREVLSSKVLSPGVVGALGAGLGFKALLIAFRSTPEIAADRR